MDQAAVQTVSSSDVGGMLAECIELDKQKKQIKKDLDGIEEKLGAVKERIKDAYIEMGVSSMKSGKKNVYLFKQLWAGVDADIPREQLAEALIGMAMEDFIACNTQKLSSYVREFAKDHPEFLNSDGEIVADPEEIIAALPEPLNKMIRVSEKIDIRIRN